MSSRRGKFEIAKDILENAIKPIGSTQLMYKCRIPHALLKKYVGKLLDVGLLEEKPVTQLVRSGTGRKALSFNPRKSVYIRKKLVTTTKGVNFLQRINELLVVYGSG